MLHNIVLQCSEFGTAEKNDLWIFMSRDSVLQAALSTLVLEVETPDRMETLSRDECWRTITGLVNVVKGGLAGRQLNGSGGTRRS